MGSLHWLVLFPYYFFTALSLYLVLQVVCRITRSKISANPVSMTAVIAAVVLTAAPLLSGSTSIKDYSWPGLVVLLVLSLVLALMDTMLKSTLPIPIDRELEDV